MELIDKFAKRAVIGWWPTFEGKKFLNKLFVFVDQQRELWLADAQSLLRHKQEMTSSLSCASLPANQPLYSPPVYSSWFTFFRKQFWQIGKIATCLEIFSDFFFIHSKSRNDDTPSSLICAALPANYPRPLPPVYPLWFSFKPFCPSLFEHVQYPP